VNRRVLVCLFGALLLFVSLPVALLNGSQRLRDYAYRELAYRVIVDEVTKNVRGDVPVTEALFRFVSTHEYAPNIPAIDTTVLDDLVRGFGWCDQQAWGLSTLLAKKGIPSTLLMLRGYDIESHHTVASVYLDRRWRIVDPFYELIFAKPSGRPATFEDLRRWSGDSRLRSVKADAIEHHHPGFDQQYVRLFQAQDEPIRWQPLTTTKDTKRHLVAGLMDFYVALLGRRFTDTFQDAWLARRLCETPDCDLLLRARHYDLLFRRDRALAAYQQLLTEHANGPYVEDALYFMGRLQLDLSRWKPAADTFRRLLAHSSPASRWNAFAPYFLGLALEHDGDMQGAIAQYRRSATNPQVDSSVRLLALSGS
jgi:hypothetical protein